MNKLKQLRKANGLTQMEMAKKLGISESYYCQIENGTRRMSLKTALDIAAILKVTPNDLFLPSNFAERQEKHQTKAG
ncbi:helix-turn-helix transcriptional regulator [Carboxydothermus hydrogenoformans]|uniref:Prophage LambdaCh01, transcriptional regulator, PBSX family n=1 Tax=Carboxydothermus hydrogenoformans (strain ATCC BAA-161 / DSM 6008 / Z-2901) TaxID=246194 RepID=Q3ABG8_CARHZ|nr:helix-turn-helix transcriptional regulator [Carboxydothermus hydrogenoformans]ABB15153.1 prophage LambdaCh01, transcriptional regulator, PBSX family [Carboxydothermus hydrogenoformans Z-2901]